MLGFTIDSRLEADSHQLFVWQGCHVRLNKNASTPWFLIIPETEDVEFCDLPIEQQNNIGNLGKIIGQYLKKHHDAEKINFAAIGNVVQQLHVHVIGRNSEDPLWPDVVWGAQLPDVAYSEQQITTIKNNLQQLLENRLP